MAKPDDGFKGVHVDMMLLWLHETWWGGESDFITQCEAVFLFAEDVSTKKDWWLMKNGGYFKRGKKCDVKQKMNP